MLLNDNYAIAKKRDVYISIKLVSCQMSLTKFGLKRSWDKGFDL